MSSPSSPSNNDLKHMLSQTVLSANPRDPAVKERVSSRASHRLSSITAKALGAGSRSPNSIPSSPTSVHSSSSAIFERDIEPLLSSSPPYPHNPHRIPRSKTTEHLEQSVPSVLNSAAAVLATTNSVADEDQITVITPAAAVSSSSGIASPIGSFGSRSPSPQGGMSPSYAGKDHRTSLLLSIPGQGQTAPPNSAFTTSSSAPLPPLSVSSQIQSPGSATRPTIKTNVSNTTQSSTPSIVTPTSAYYSLASSGSSPTTTTVEHPPNVLPSPSSSSTRTVPLYHQHAANTATNLSHPPSPTNNASKRLSFISYSDLLTSTPTSVHPLSSHTHTSSTEQPPHIPCVSGLTQYQAASVGLSSSAASGSGSSNASVYGMMVKEGDVGEDIGGEWTREGLGRGLEERLEALMMPMDVRASA